METFLHFLYILVGKAISFPIFCMQHVYVRTKSDKSDKTKKLAERKDITQNQTNNSLIMPVDFVLPTTI